MSDKDINEWTAKKCGVFLYAEPYFTTLPIFWLYFKLDSVDFDYKWDFRDPRCMVTIRKYFGIETDWNIPTEGVIKWESCSNIGSVLVEDYESPHDADTQCVIKLYEAEHE